MECQVLNKVLLTFVF